MHIDFLFIKKHIINYLLPVETK